MIFLDSNVPIYAADQTDAKKHRCAREILARALDGDDFMVSVLRTLKVAELGSELTIEALKLKDRTGLQFYNSLIVATAHANGCSEVWSEDMSDGCRYDGVAVHNPFVKSA